MMAKAGILAFALSLIFTPKSGLKEETPFGQVVKARVEKVADATYEVYTNGYDLAADDHRDVKPLYEVTDARTRDEALDMSAKLLMRVVKHESAFTVDALNKKGNDCGLGQVKPKHILKLTDGKKTCADVRKDVVLGTWVTIASLQDHKNYCLSRLPEEKQKDGIKAVYWLGAYACGTCGGCQSVARELCVTPELCDSK